MLNLKSLTPRERAIVDRVSRGMAYRDIAEEFQITLKTVTGHANNIHRKLGIKAHVFLRVALKEKSNV